MAVCEAAIVAIAEQRCRAVFTAGTLTVLDEIRWGASVATRLSMVAPNDIHSMEWS